jgi:hypothetical protein
MTRPIHFTARKHYGKAGDIMMYQPPKVTVYRNGKLMTSFDLSRAAVEALLKNGIMNPVDHPAVVAPEPLPVDVKEPETPAAPAPVIETPEPPAVIVVPEPAPIALDEAAAAQILAVELGPDDDDNLPDEPEVPADPAAAPADDVVPAAAAPKVSRRNKAAAAAATT